MKAAAKLADILNGMTSEKKEGVEVKPENPLEDVRFKLICQMTQALASNPEAIRTANAFKGEGVTVENYIVDCATQYADALLGKMTKG